MARSPFRREQQREARAQVEALRLKAAQTPMQQGYARLAEGLSPRRGVADTSWHVLVRERMREPHAEQVRFLQSRAKRKVIRGGRRGGKTVGVALIALEAFLAGQRVLYAVPTDDQLERFWFEVKRALEVVIDAGYVYKNETRHILELRRTEVRIRGKTAWNADTLRGDYADVLILDEFQLMAEDAWGRVGAPMLLDNDGDAVFIYTPPSVESRAQSKAIDKQHAAKRYKQALADTSGRWQAFHFSSHANPHLSVEALGEITGDMSVLAHRQEILAEDIEDIPGALWTAQLLERARVLPVQVPTLTRVTVALDPSGGSQATADEMGIVAGGRGVDGHGYVLRDATLRGTPAQCARVALQLYDLLEADVLVGEANNGGEWIGTVLEFVAQEMYRLGERKSPHVHYQLVYASRGKQTRAAPIATESEQQRLHLVGAFPALEEELTTWVPGMASPNRLDALVWAFTDLLLGQYVPHELDLSASLDLTQPTLTARAIQEVTMRNWRQAGLEEEEEEDWEAVAGIYARLWRP
jgi:hypothetical protein